MPPPSPFSSGPSAWTRTLPWPTRDWDRTTTIWARPPRPPKTRVKHTSCVSGYERLNRLDEAKATAQEAQAHNLDSPTIHLVLYFVDFLQHDSAGMEREATQVMGKPGYEDVMLYTESDTAAYAGQFVKARELTRRAADSARRADEKETAAGYEAEAAV